MDQSDRLIDHDRIADLFDDLAGQFASAAGCLESNEPDGIDAAAQWLAAAARTSRRLGRCHRGTSTDSTGHRLGNGADPAGPGLCFL
jgi:hypothetical protein